MVARTKIESVDEVRRWYEEGLTYRQMADRHLEKYGVQVSPSGFSSVRRKMGWESRLAGESPLMPWHIKKEHQSTYIYLMLRREIRRREGLPWMSKDPTANLDAWIDGIKSNGAVIDYRPDTKNGFFLTYARPGIDNDLIREPEVS